MRAVWTDAGNDADPVKLHTYGIDSPYFAVTDPRVTLAYLRSVQAAGFQPGVYAAWNWQPGLGGPAFASWLSAQLERVAPDTSREFPKVCVDIETHDVAYIRAFLRRWRQLRPHRVTDWTLEGFQGGLFSPMDVIAIAAANVGVIPQLYGGAGGTIQFQRAADRVALDLVEHSFPPARIFGFYDAAALPERWEGYAFTQ